MEMTSAYANKLLRQLNEEKEFLLNQEENSAPMCMPPTRSR